MVRSVSFWDEAANGVYDRLVLGSEAPPDIKRLLMQEDQILIRTLDRYTHSRENVVFIEVGSGTGRYMKLLGKRVILDELYSHHLKYIVGIDFSERMIRTSINNLSHPKTVEGEMMPSFSREVCSETGLEPSQIAKILRERMLFVNADATRPFLRSSINAVVGIMFGTLGNVPEHSQLLKNSARVFQNKGKLIITVFNREVKEVGLKGYEELVEKGFKSLAPLRWDKRLSAFTSVAGFYSRWFSYREFRELLEKHAFGTTNVIPIATQGLLAIVDMEREMADNQSSKNRIQDSLDLLCPSCGDIIAPLPSKAHNMSCRMCGTQYTGETIDGFYVARLVKPKSTSGGV